MHLVLGATGGSGYWSAQKLIAREESVRLLVRDPTKIPELIKQDGVEVVKGDALNKEDVRGAAKGASTIFYCVNAPYNLWTKVAAPMLETTISVAKEVGAKIVFPSNVYIFGHVNAEFVNEDYPRNPHTKKGRIRVQLEKMFDDAWKNDKVPYTIVRMPDFYGPHVPNPIYADVFRNVSSGKPMPFYGKLDAPFECVYIEDVGEALVTAGLDRTTAGETYHLPGMPTTGKDWLTLVAKEAGTSPRIRVVSPFMVWLVGLWNPLAREFYEMLYLKRERLLLDGSKYKAKFGNIPQTPYAEGIKKTLEWFRLEMRTS
jgi:nucleoside-diphosphate-sugar epimerase